MEPVDFGLPTQGGVGPWGIVVLSRGDPVDPGPGVARGQDIPNGPLLQGRDGTPFLPVVALLYNYLDHPRGRLTTYVHDRAVADVRI